MLNLTTKKVFFGGVDVNQEASLVDLDFYTTSLPMLPWTGYACDTCKSQELQQQKDATSTNIEQVPKSFEDSRKAKGKEIVIVIPG
ncbi:hypothetical protein K1719_020753 [Acacia pycnantha]|nr:hypothetical protein K1719_020753 [Acacia pycnantha]